MDLSRFNELTNSLTEADKNKFYKFTPEPISIQNLKSHFFNAHGITSDCLESDVIVVDKLVARLIETANFDYSDGTSDEDLFSPSEEIAIYSPTFCLPITGYCYPISIEGDGLDAEIKINNNLSADMYSYSVLPAGTVVSCNDENFEAWVYSPINGVYQKISSTPTGPIWVHSEKEGVGNYSNSVMVIDGLVGAPGNYTLSVAILNLLDGKSTAFLVPIGTIIEDAMVLMKEPYHFKYSEGDDPEHNMYLSISGSAWGELTIEIEDRGVSN
jgi:hypothetical protein